MKPVRKPKYSGDGTGALYLDTSKVHQQDQACELQGDYFSELYLTLSQYNCGVKSAVCKENILRLGSENSV